MEGAQKRMLMISHSSRTLIQRSVRSHERGGTATPGRSQTYRQWAAPAVHTVSDQYAVSLDRRETNKTWNISGPLSPGPLMIVATR